MIRILFKLVCLVAIGSAAQASEGQLIPDSSKPSVIRESSGAPIVVDSDTLFFVSARVFSFSPEDRARTINEKLRRIVEDRSLNPDSIVIQETEAGSEIMVGEVIVMTVTEMDAGAAGMDRKALAETILSRIRSTVTAAREQHSLKNLVMAGVYTVATVIVLVVLLWGMRRLFTLLYTKLRGWQGSRIRTLKVQNLEILSAERATNALIRLSRLLRFVLTLLILYAAASLILGFFPQTRYVSSYLAAGIWSLIKPMVMAVVHYLPNLVVIVVLLILGYYAVKLVRFFFDSVKAGHISLPGFYVEWTETTYKIVRLAVIALFVVLLFPYLPGSDSPAFKGVSIFIGLLFSLGSTSIVANIVAGIILTYMRPFKVDDRVKIADTVGDIVEKTILVTRIRTIKNVLITIPNAMVLSSHIINYSASIDSEPLVLHTAVTIGYDAPWRKIHELLIAAAKATEHVLEEPKPFVLQLSLDDFYVRYELNAYTDSPRSMAVIYSDLHQNIQDKFNEAGVEIMSPHYDALRDGAAASIPPEYKSDDSKTKSIRVRLIPDQPSAAQDNDNGVRESDR
ncbi:MAG: mechanosensitive ion channel family protein [candidate division Zixibacteria bacterium]|nr:mechanosensitive ion channel family protein [candidate division Zixibacteria bacterium]